MKILFFSFRGVLVDRELTETLRNSGNEVKELDFTKLSPEADFFTIIKEEIARFSPAFILTTNSLGFDTKGVIAELLDREKIYYVTWELDQPCLQFYFGQRCLPPSDYYLQFIWDEGYLEELRNLGYRNVFHLPLGCFTDAFDKFKGMASAYSYDVSFVGITSLEFIDKMYATGSFIHSMETPWIMSILQTVLTRSLEKMDQTIPEIVKREFPSIEEKFPTELETKRFITFLEIMNGLLYRKEIVTWPEKLEVFGDSAWKLFGVKNLHKPLNYYEELASVYNSSRINLNITLSKNRWDSNQRIFDVPVAYGFVLTDFRKNLERYFLPEKEIVIYTGKEELLDKLEFYSENIKSRLEITERARKRIFKEHTIGHRVNTLLEIVTKYLK